MTTTKGTTAKKTAAKRPSAARRHTRTTAQQQQDELDRGIAFTDHKPNCSPVKDRCACPRLQVRLRDVKGIHDAALVEATGYDFMGLMEAAERRQGLDLMAGLVWFGRLVNGDAEKTYLETLEEFGYNDVVAANFDEPKAGDDRPEA